MQDGMCCVKLNPYGATYKSLTGRIFKNNNTKAGAIIVKFQYIVQISHYSYNYTLIIVFKLWAAVKIGLKHRQNLDPPWFYPLTFNTHRCITKAMNTH